MCSFLFSFHVTQFLILALDLNSVNYSIWVQIFIFCTFLDDRCQFIHASLTTQGHALHSVYT